jgi:Flp pilus assembly protein TadG
MDANMKNTKAARRSERGQSFVEFSIVVVFLVMLVAGVADLGRAFFSYLSLQDAAQEGATYASAYPTWCYRTNVRVRDTVRNLSSLTVQVYIDNVLGCQNGTVVSAGTLTGACLGKEVKVVVTQNDYAITTPFIGGIIGTQTLTLTADAIDYVLRPNCP